MRNRFGGAIALGISLVLSSAIFGAFVYQSRHEVKTVSVVGVSTKRFGSDIVKWRATLARTTGTENVKDGYKLLKSDLDTFAEMLNANGIPSKDLIVQPANVSPLYGNNGSVISGYSITQSMYLASRQIDKLEKIALNPSLLVDRGVFLQSSSLEFYSSELNQIKKDLLAAATRDAKMRAQRIAESSGNHITQIVSARAGVFQITEPYSTETSDYGVYNTSTREKDITVTMSVQFGLK